MTRVQTDSVYDIVMRSDLAKAFPERAAAIVDQVEKGRDSSVVLVPACSRFIGLVSCSLDSTVDLY